MKIIKWSDYLFLGRTQDEKGMLEQCLFLRLVFVQTNHGLPRPGTLLIS